MMHQLSSAPVVPGIPVSVPGTPAPGATRPASVAGKSELIDAAFDEFCLLRETGEQVDPEEFCNRYPAFQSSLRRVVGAHLLLEANPSFLGAIPEVQWPQPGERFLDWVLQEELGRGAFARVFLATEPALGGRRVALKLSPRGGAEGWTLGRLQHPNIVPILSIQEASGAGLTALCMPFLGRATLCDLLDHLQAEKRLPTRAQTILDVVERCRRPGDASSGPRTSVLQHGTYVEGVVATATALAEALRYLHEQKVSHGDLKPSNVLLASDGSPLLLDFNLALDQAQTRQRLGGTPAYMAPEQLRAMDPLGTSAEELAPQHLPACDLYALGVVLYELLSGKHPFGPLALNLNEEEKRVLLLSRQAQGARPLHEINSRVDPILSRIVHRLLAYAPEDRYPSAQEVVHDLRRWQRGVRRWLRRRAPVLLGCLLALVLVGSVAAVAVSTHAAPRDTAYQAGVVSYKQGRYDEAVEHYRRALQADPHSSTILLALGRTEQRRGEPTQALEYLRQAHQLQVRSGKLDGWTQAAYGYCLAEEKHWGAAAKVLQEACTHGAKNAAVLNNLGFCLAQQNELKEAEKVLDQAIQADPNLGMARFNRAWVALRRCESDSARQYNPRQGIADIRDVLSSLRSSRVPLVGAHLCSHAMERGLDESKQGTAFVRQTLERGYALSKVQRQTRLQPFLVGIAVDDLHITQVAEEPFAQLIDPLAD